MLMNLFKFKGGVKPPTNKTQSVGLPIAIAPIPSRLVVPLHQSIGGTPMNIEAAAQQPFMEQELTRWDRLIRSTGIQLD